MHSFFLQTNLATGIHVLITFRLDCCIVLYMGLPLKIVQTLHVAENGAEMCFKTELC